MSLNTLIKVGITALLGGPIIEILIEKAGQKATEIFHEKFTFTAFEIAKTYQESYSYALAAITAGLVEPDEKISFLQSLTQSKVKREFAEQIERDYLQAFAAQQGRPIAQCRQQLIEQIKKLVELPPIFTAENRRFTESELAALIKDDGAVAITDLILAQLQDLDETLKAFLRYNDLLGKATLFFFRELLQNDPRAKTTLESLQREHLLVKVDQIKSTQDQLISRLLQQLDEQNAKVKQALKEGAPNLSQITSQRDRLQNAIEVVPQRLQSAVSDWQKNHQAFIEFSHQFSTWTQLLDSKVDKVLEAVGSLGDIDKNVKTLLQELRDFMQRYDLSRQVKPRDEFTQHNSASLELIRSAIAKLKLLPSDNAHYHQLVIMAGTVVSSTGDIAEAENLFVQARELSRNKAEKALASFNLFQVKLRRQAYPEALADFQSAIANDPSYALHNLSRYPIQKLLGAGGMGCVFLAHDVDEYNKPVVVKCFWEGRQGKRNEIFKEAILMRDIASQYVPKPLHWDYADAIRDQKPYFVTEYIEGALDGETWLKEEGKLDIETGLSVGIEIAKGLQVAHEHQIYHLDLKPANLLLKKNGSISVKIIDFGLARVGTSLRDNAHSATGKTQFGQRIMGTLYYAPPEQLGYTEYGKPSAKSDLYAFSGTLYRLMTGEIPHPLNPICLTEAPPALFELLCQCLSREPAQRPDSAEDVVKQLTEIKAGLSRTRSVHAGIPLPRVGTRTTVPVPPPPKPEVRQFQQQQSSSIPKKRSPRFILGLGFVIVLGVLIWFGVREQPKLEEPTIAPVEPSEPQNFRQADDNKVFQDRLKDGSLGPEMVKIPAGRFRMGDIQGGGSSDEKPVHEVSVSAFAMGKYEVTFAEYDKFAEATGREKPSDSGWGRENRPVINVSWNDANAYAEWLSTQTGKQYRLPTEAEWEYAARAGTETKYWWGNTASHEYANYGADECCSGLAEGKDRWEYTAPVGSFAPNQFGLYDTVGNVWEWCADSWHDNYEGAPNDGSVWEGGSGSSRVLRGGSWLNFPWFARTAIRDWDTSDVRDDICGFRVVSSVAWAL
jgi:formylglycine-generating enzyme required for sulfatase activity/tetratricopeptide (TPR) repeat protein